MRSSLSIDSLIRHKMPEIRLTPHDLSCITEKAAEKKQENVISAFIARKKHGGHGIWQKVADVFAKAQPRLKASFRFAEQDSHPEGPIADVYGTDDDLLLEPAWARTLACGGPSVSHKPYYVKYKKASRLSLPVYGPAMPYARFPVLCEECIGENVFSP